MTKMNTYLSNILPTVSGGITYNAENKVFLTMGWTSAAGNTYYKALRVGKRLCVYFDMGQGYAHTFLNGITLLMWDGQQPRVIAKRDFYCNIYDGCSARRQATEMVEDYLKSQLKLIGQCASDSELKNFAKQAIDDAYQQKGISAAQRKCSLL